MTTEIETLSALLRSTFLLAENSDAAAQNNAGLTAFCNVLATAILTRIPPASRTITAGAGLTGGGDLSADRTINVAAGDSSISVGADSITVGTISDTQHGSRGGATLHAEASDDDAGFIPAGYVSEIDRLSAHVTTEGGLAVLLTNKTGGNSVKGTLVRIATGQDSSFVLADVGADDCIGVVYDSGIADGYPCYIVVAGVAEVLIESGETIGRRYWLRSPSATAGRGSLHATPGGGSVAEHFKECGHCLETKVNGGSTLAKCVVHFN